MSRFHVEDRLHLDCEDLWTTLYVLDREKQKRLTREELQAELDAFDAFREKEACSKSEKVALEAQVNAAPPKLTAVQKRVLKALVHGWKAVRNGESFLSMDDGSICKTKTMLALKDMGLVRLGANGTIYEISEAGRLIRGKL